MGGIVVSHKLYDGKFEVLQESATERYYPIRPEHIHTGESGCFLSTFGKAEIEEAAERLVLFFKTRGYWCGFAIDELINFYHQNDWKFGKAFFGLMGAWYDDAAVFSLMNEPWREPSDVYIAIGPTGLFHVTDRFVLRCANAADPTGFLNSLNQIVNIIDHMDDLNN